MFWVLECRETLLIFNSMSVRVKQSYVSVVSLPENLTC